MVALLKRASHYFKTLILVACFTAHQGDFYLIQLSKLIYDFQSIFSLFGFYCHSIYKFVFLPTLLKKMSVKNN